MAASGCGRCGDAATSDGEAWSDGEACRAFFDGDGGECGEVRDDLLLGVDMAPASEDGGEVRSSHEARRLKLRTCDWARVVLGLGLRGGNLCVPR